MSTIGDIGTALGLADDEVRRFVLSRRETEQGVEIVGARLGGRSPERNGEHVAIAAAVRWPDGRTFDRIAVALLLGGRVTSSLRFDGDSAQGMSDIVLGAAYQLARMAG